MWFSPISTVVRLHKNNEICPDLKFISYGARSNDAQFMSRTALKSAKLDGSHFWLNGHIKHVESVIDYALNNFYVLRQLIMTFAYLKWVSSATCINQGKTKEFFRKARLAGRAIHDNPLKQCSRHLGILIPRQICTKLNI